MVKQLLLIGMLLILTTGFSAPALAKPVEQHQQPSSLLTTTFFESLYDYALLSTQNKHFATRLKQGAIEQYHQQGQLKDAWLYFNAATRSYSDLEGNTSLPKQLGKLAQLLVSQ